MRTVLQHVETVSPREVHRRSLAFDYLSRHTQSHNALRGQRFATFANDWLGMHVNIDGYYAKQTLDLAFLFLQPLLPDFATGLALDVGANIGNHSVYFDKLFSRVVAFEPNPLTFALLRFNAANGRHIEARNCGLGDVAGRFFMRDNPTNVGGVRIDPAAGESSTGIPIEVRRLDECDLSLENLQLIKLDVEGFEPHVLRGGLATLEQHRPVLLFEQHADEFAHGTSEAIELLRPLGYEFCWESQDQPHPRSWRRVAAWLDYVTGTRKIRRRIVSAPDVPPADYESIIAVPPQHRRRLGL
jgi:FkbM family methyltransferase